MVTEHTSNPTGSDTFELGLVMAGAVSAGAYTAGVIDFLLQALATWYQAKNQNQADIPPHHVKISVMAGASAGGLTAAVAAVALGGEIEPVTQIPPPPSVNNKLYENWVGKIDIKYLLGQEDLQDENQPVKSLLDTTILDRISDETFNMESLDIQRPYIDDPLAIYLSISNLRGIPYNIRFGGASSAGHELSLRADYMAFMVSDRPDSTPAAGLWLDPSDYRHPNWQVLKNAALASGAFPIGLAPRILTRNARDYNLRRWLITRPYSNLEDELRRCRDLMEIPPYWPEGFFNDETGQADYTFLSVDGGLMDNEPLELARRHLAMDQTFNPRSADQVSRTVILIDPFPHDAPFSLDYEPTDDLISVITGMFASLRHQARFKLEELVLAMNEGVYSRFLIAPTRSVNDQESPFPLASGILGGFGGFLSEAFRQHDFQLGRRNCQQFLRKYFALPEAANNPLFDGWTDTMKAQYRIQRGEETYLPIIPLIGSVAEEIEPLPWPQYSQAEFKVLEERVEARTRLVLDRLMRQYIRDWLIYPARFILWRKRRQIVSSIMRTIQTDLEKRDLMART